MEDIFSAARDGNVRYVRQWLDNTENDLNEGDDHGFTALHWACREGQMVIFEMLIARGGRVNGKNDGLDSPLHLACSHGRKDIVMKELVSKGAFVSQCNKNGETPLEKAKPHLANILREKAKSIGQDLSKIPFKESKIGNNKTINVLQEVNLEIRFSSTYKAHCPVAITISAMTQKLCLEFLTLKSKNSGIDLEEVHLVEKISGSFSGELYKGVWANLPIIAKKLKIKNLHKRIALHFCEEYPKLRIFSHPNVLPVVGAVTKVPHLMLVTQYMPYGSLYNILHEGTGIVVDQAQTVKFAMDITKGMAYLHSMDPLIPRLHLSSTHVMIDDDLTARISMADARFSFSDHTKVIRPNWMSPEMLNNEPETVDQRSADMWSFAIILWELSTREVPFANLTPMEMGMKIALEGLRPTLLPGTSSHFTKLINICWNADPAKRPRFDQILPILQKM